MGRLQDLVAKKQAVRDWHLVKLAPEADMQMTIGFRSEVPAGIQTEQYPQRVTVRSTYPHEGDGLPTSDRLLLMQQLDQRAVSRASILMMTKAGNGRRESTFQVVDGDAFVNNTARLAAELGIEIETGTADDPTWSYWRDIVSKFPRS
ncbi:MAG TPA: DUF695 domain-containing protein [Kofleriaceae bacterium]|jgi:hypothetical protein